MSFAMFRRSTLQKNEQTPFLPWLCGGPASLHRVSILQLPLHQQPRGDIWLGFCHLRDLVAGFLTVGNKSLSALRELS